MPGTTHGLSYSPEYMAYQNAQQHCTNPKAAKYANYGGRGIEFRFTSFEQWYAELGPRPVTPVGRSVYSVDRKNVNGHYEPGNVRWATKSEQGFNKRRVVALENYTDAELLAEVKRRSLT
jgi:hypothetical protein